MSEQPVNPFQAPRVATNSPSDVVLPASAVNKATNLVRDAKLAVAVALMPMLGLIFILRLVQWYLLRKQYPVLASGDAGEHKELAKQFRAARSSFWFAVLMWPVAAVVTLIAAAIYLR